MGGGNNGAGSDCIGYFLYLENDQMILKVLTLENLETARQWRNGLMAAWRTPFMLTKEMQEDFYRNVICNRQSNLRYWGFHVEDASCIGFPLPMNMGLNTFIGFGGIENIHLENRTGEISILIGPEYRNGGAGSEALKLMLHEAFNILNLDVVWAECYLCNESIEWWDKMGEKYNTETYELPYRKYYNGQMYPARFYYFKRETCVSVL